VCPSVLTASEVFKALGSPTRLRMLQIIASTGNDLCVGMIAKRLGVSQPAVSQQLKVLKDAGLITAHERGHYVHHEVRTACLEEFGIDTAGFLRTLEAELNLDKSCEHLESSAACRAMHHCKGH